MNTASVLLASLIGVQGTPLLPGDHVRSLEVGGQSRSYLVHLPPSYDPGKPAPLVLAFHPAAMNGASMAGFCGLNEKADRSGFVVVYPNGTGSTPLFLYWDAGGVRGRPSDDVGFVAKLLVDLATVVHIDPRRVFATGMSNGAMLCYRLASELSVEVKTYGPGKDDSEVILYAIEGGGHTWPGREPPIPFLGKSTKEITANDLIWEFFQKHPMRSVPAGRSPWRDIQFAK